MNYTVIGLCMLVGQALGAVLTLVWAVARYDLS
jgi:hypothetical protein